MTDSEYLIYIICMTEYLAYETAFRGSDILVHRSKFRLLLAGCGALGSNLADQLAKQGYSSMGCVDRDRVEHGNLGTQNFTPSDIGYPKATQVAFNLFNRLSVRIDSVKKETKKKKAHRSD